MPLTKFMKTYNDRLTAPTATPATLTAVATEASILFDEIGESPELNTIVDSLLDNSNIFNDENLKYKFLTRFLEDAAQNSFTKQLFSKLYERAPRLRSRLGDIIERQKDMALGTPPPLDLTGQYTGIQGLFSRRGIVPSVADVAAQHEKMTPATFTKLAKDKNAVIYVFYNGPTAGAVSYEFLLRKITDYHYMRRNNLLEKQPTKFLDDNFIKRTTFIRHLPNKTTDANTMQVYGDAKTSTTELLYETIDGGQTFRQLHTAAPFTPALDLRLDTYNKIHGDIIADRFFNPQFTQLVADYLKEKREASGMKLSIRKVFRDWFESVLEPTNKTPNAIRRAFSQAKDIEKKLLEAMDEFTTDGGAGEYRLTAMLAFQTFAETFTRELVKQWYARGQASTMRILKDAEPRDYVTILMELLDKVLAADSIEWDIGEASIKSYAIARSNNMQSHHHL